MKPSMASSAQMRLLVLIVLVVLVVLGGAGARRAWPAALVHAASVVNFIATDDVGPWFQCVGAGCVQAGTQSLAVVNPGTDVRITVGQRERHGAHVFKPDVTRPAPSRCRSINRPPSGRTARASP